MNLNLIRTHEFEYAVEKYESEFNLNLNKWLKNLNLAQIKLFVFVKMSIFVEISVFTFKYNTIAFEQKKFVEYKKYNL